MDEKIYAILGSYGIKNPNYNLVTELHNLIVSERDTAVKSAKIKTSEFYHGTLSDRELRELSRTTLNTWRMFEDNL